jgi:hypothetical protein
MTRLTLALALALAPATEGCPHEKPTKKPGEIDRVVVNPPVAPCATVSYSMTGDGQNGIIRDAAGTIVASKDVNAEHVVSTQCAAGSHVRVVLKHQSTAMTLFPPSQKECMGSRSPSGQAIWFDMPAGKECDLTWTPDPSSPGIPFPIRVRP